MTSQGEVNSNIYGIRFCGDYEIIEHLIGNMSATIQVLQTPDYASDRLDNDGEGKQDEFMEAWELNSSGFTLSISYRF